MFARIAAAALTLTMLGAGAFVFAPAGDATAEVASANVTIVQKNQVWPLKGNITTNPCALAACEEV